MDPAHIFGSVPPRHAQPKAHRHHLSDDDSAGQRVAHTLTACCRCRQRKTRCDPTLPRCLPCERAGSTCEYLDTAKGKKINRYYVIKLQDKVKALEAELDLYTHDEPDHPPTNEDIMRPGGMILPKSSDETPRYLGPSSGIAMTRLLMEEAKRYTDSQRISELIPELRARSRARMQSIQMTGLNATRKKSYPLVSERPAESLPKRETADKLVEMYRQKAQTAWPVLHEKDFLQDVDDVYKGSSDAYKNFVVRMVIAISLQKLEVQYAGLADSYYVAAMRFAEAVIRPKDVKSLQCLILIAQYSLHTPTRTPVYYVIGLATRICQQEGLIGDKALTTSYVDAKTLDMRRRLAWTVAAFESNLSYHMGRPSGFATTNDGIAIDLFATVDDDHITPAGIQPGPVSDRKLVAIHIFKTRHLQAELRRVLYEKKRPEPKSDAHPWYAKFEHKLKQWLDEAPDSLQWFRAWFAASYHQMRIVLYRPSPQVPQPSARAAGMCFDSAAFVLQQARKQLDSGNASITWIFLLMLNTALNALLWATSFAEVRHSHPRDHVDELVNLSLLCLDRCAERWPGTANTSELYAIIAKACLQSYDARPATTKPVFSFASPPSTSDPQSSPDAASTMPYLNPPHFGFVFDSPPESINAFAFDPAFAAPPHPTFRSNSIFCNPATESSGRRFSYFPPDFMHANDAAPDDAVLSSLSISPDATLAQALAQTPAQQSQLPTPPESLAACGLSVTTSSTSLSPPGMLRQTPNLSDAPPDATMSVEPQHKFAPPQPAAAAPAFPNPRPPAPPPSSLASQPPHQRPLPASSAEWFSPPAPFISPYSFGGSVSGSFFNDAMPNTFAESPVTGLGLHHMSAGLDAMAPMSLHGRQGSLTHSQQLELMNALETEGVGDIDAFLNAGNEMVDATWY
ncbi:hypothetical protein CDD82_1367 [Ophiocordyceps australis]|uniref:Zn(2)-C6 fungal-type domain-containing protein n=1 Tax=Ophiocordyceps australis TaxID=1399860 RepID=A0A2C5YIU7_9HYPO|nr:hypothetical protein CDD82_1367 [Ophiocordyceps australis]